MDQPNQHSIHPLCAMSPDMEPDDFQALRDSISAIGLKHRISLLGTEIVDGRHRYAALQELGVPLTEEHFEEIPPGTDLVLFLRAKHLARRDLTTSQKAWLANKMSEWSQAGGNRRGGDLSDHSANLPNGSAVQGYNQGESARMYGVSVRSVGDARKVDRQAPEEVGRAIQSGKVTVSDAAGIADQPPETQIQALEAVQRGETRTMRAAVKAMDHSKEDAPAASPGEPGPPGEGPATGGPVPLPKAPDPRPAGEYRTVVVDPPWPAPAWAAEVYGEEVVADYQARAMSIDGIANMELPLADDGFVFLWCPQRHLPQAFAILEAWGVEYRCVLAWKKTDGVCLPDHPRSDVELIVMAAKGNPEFTDDTPFSSVVNGGTEDPSAIHPAKPREFYATLAPFVPGPRIVLPESEPSPFEEFKHLVRRTGEHSAG